MNKTTLKALNESIAKWEQNAKAETPYEYKTGGEHCPLCAIFAGGYCDGCPVTEKGRAGCSGTPYYAAQDAHHNWVYGTPASRELRNAARAAARKEVSFLRSLLPESAQ